MTDGSIVHAAPPTTTHGHHHSLHSLLRDGRVWWWVGLRARSSACVSTHIPTCVSYRTHVGMCVLTHADTSASAHTSHCPHRLVATSATSGDGAGSVTYVRRRCTIREVHAVHFTVVALPRPPRHPRMDSRIHTYVRPLTLLHSYTVRGHTYTYRSQVHAHHVTTTTFVHRHQSHSSSPLVALVATR